MTDPTDGEEHEGFVGKLLEKAPAINVHIVGSDINKVEGTPYASFSYQLIAGLATDMPVQILAQDLHRKRAVIQVSPGLTAANVLGYVILGELSQIQARRGYIMVSGNQIVMEHGRAVWLIGDGATHELTVSIEDERYQT